MQRQVAGIHYNSATCIAEQAGGGMDRQALYHDIHLLERTLRTFAQPADAPLAEHPISPHLPWVLPVLLQVCSIRPVVIVLND